jgi:outer membrane receptor protein involved in Fe transport
MQFLQDHTRALLACVCLAPPWAAFAQSDAAPATTALEPVTVLGHYDNAVGTSNAASEGTVTAKLLANRPALRPAELLEFVPGVIVTQHSGDGKANQYFLRGFNLDHGTDFATFVDGMPVNMVSHAHGQGYSDLNFLIPELVRRIDYRKGPYFARDGDFASAGTARIHLADAMPRGLAQLTLGANGYRRALLADSHAFGTTQLLGAAELQGNDGPWRVPQDLRRFNGWLRLGDKTDDQQRSVTLMVYNARWTATDQVPQRAVDAAALDRFGSLDASDGGRTQRVSLSGQWRASVPGGQWQVSAYAIGSRLNLWSNFTYFLDDPVNGDQFEQAERRRVAGGELSRRWNVELAGIEHQATLGLQLRRDRLSPVGLYTTVQRTRLGTTQESRVRQTQAGLYGELASAWRPWLKSVAGLRADRARFEVRSSIADNSGSASSTLTSPKLSLIFGPWQQSEFFANWGRGFHSNDARGTAAKVSPREGTSIESVPGLAKNRGMELGARTQLVAGLQSSLALWRLDLDSELVFVGDAGDTEASRASRRRGVEWNNHWTLGQLAAAFDGWLLDLDLAASRARFKDQAPEGDRVPGAVNRVASLGLGYEGRGPWFGQFQVRHFGPRDLVEDGTQRSAGTTIASLRGGWRLSDRMTLTADVFNLFDRAASDIDYFYTSRLAGEPAEGVADRHFHPVEPRSLRLTLALGFW